MRNSAAQNRVLIIGCGSLGSVLASRLCAEAQVACFDTDPKRVTSIRKKMRTVNRLRDLQGELFDLIIVATKCQDVTAAVQDCSRWCQSRSVMFLQNGDFSLSFVSRLMPDVEILRGVTTSAIESDGEGKPKVLHQGIFYLGVYRNSKRSDSFDAGGLFRLSGMTVREVEDYRRSVWAKLIFSSVMNPLPILTGKDYMVIQQDPGVYRLVTRAIEEGKRIADKRKIGLAFDPMDPVRRLRLGRWGNFSYRGSMFTDYINKRPLELEYITGALIRHARRVNLETPVLDTIYTVTKFMENNRGA